MRVLVAVDENPYSLYAVDQAARFAANTWPDITLLAVEKVLTSPVMEDDAPLEKQHPKIRLLRRYRADLMGFLGSSSEVYASGTPSTDAVSFHPAGKNLLEEHPAGARKEMLLRLRAGHPVKAILTEARALESDLVILGCGQGCAEWEGEKDVPGKVTAGADCSVLVVRDDTRPTRVVCCLGHDDISQKSLEMINQLVTLHGADLEIVGILRRGELKESVERKMGEVLDYYLQRGVRALVKVVEEREMESFVSTGAHNDLMALWLSPQSALQRIFSRERFASLINTIASSMLILR